MKPAPTFEQLTMLYNMQLANCPIDYRHLGPRVHSLWSIGH